MIAEILALYEQGGAAAYFGERVTQLQHALQAAQCAERAHADEELIGAALLHDIGHLLSGDFHAELGVIDHDRTCVEWLHARGFSARFTALVAGHVKAKRYLVAKHPEYLQKLSPTSLRTLGLQGGAMSPREVTEFESSPYCKDLLRLRAWDEEAKDPGAVTPGLEHYVPLLGRLCGELGIAEDIGDAVK